jgi:hypothetical protein
MNPIRDQRIVHLIRFRPFFNVRLISLNRLATFSMRSGRMTASLHRKRLAHDSFGEGEMWLRGVFD